jgi:hypothetical protein
MVYCVWIVIDRIPTKVCHLIGGVSRFNVSLNKGVDVLLALLTDSLLSCFGYYEFTIV